MNNQQSIYESEIESAQNPNLRSGEKARRQMFELESSRLAKLSALRGEENDYNCQAPEISKIIDNSCIRLDGQMEPKITEVPLVWRKNWPKMLVLIFRFQRYFKYVLIKSHPQKLNRLQYRLINDQGAQFISDGWEETARTLNTNYSKNSRANDPTSTLFGNSKLIIKTIKQFQKLSKKMYQHLRKLKEKIQRGGNSILGMMPLISSQSTMYIIWDVLLYSLSLVSCIYMPFQMAFLPKAVGLTEERLISKYIVLFMFVINIVIQLNLTYFDEDCTLIKEKKKIIQHYFRKNLLLDIFLVISLSVIESDQRATMYTIRTGLFFWRLVYRNSNISRILDQHIYTDYGKAIRNLFVLFQKIIFCCHIFACYYYLLGERSSEQNGKSWLTYISEQMNDTIYSKYINSFYFSVVTMSTIGYGDIAPITDNQKLFMIFMSLIASMLFGYTINSLATIFSEYDQKQLEYNKKNEELNQYFRDHDIDQGLQNRSQKYLEFMEKGGNSEQYSIQCLNNLSPFLQDQILQSVYFQTVKNISFISDNFSYSFKQSISNNFQQQIFAPDQPIIMSRYQTEPTIYFIHRGRVELFIQVGENSNDNIVSLSLKQQGEMFGMRQFLINSMEPNISVRSQGICVIHSISLQEFLCVLQRYPGDREKFMELRDNYIFKEDSSILNETCLSCKSLFHQTLECPYTDYCVQKKRIIYNSNLALNLFKRNYLRKTQIQISALNKRNYTIERIENFQINFLADLLVYESDHLPQFNIDLVEGTINVESEYERLNQEESEKGKMEDLLVESIQSQNLDKNDQIGKFTQSEGYAAGLDNFQEWQNNISQSSILKSINLPSEKYSQESENQCEPNIFKRSQSIKLQQSKSAVEIQQKTSQIGNQESIRPVDENSIFQSHQPASERSRSIKNSAIFTQKTPSTKLNMPSDLRTYHRQKLDFEQIKNFVNYQIEGNFNQIKKKLITSSIEYQQNQILKSQVYLVNNISKSPGLNSVGNKFRLLKAADQKQNDLKGLTFEFHQQY